MKIKEISKKFGITADTLRYYEKVGLIYDVQRDKNGIREYSQENCDTIAFVKCMRSANISIDGLVKYMALYRQGDSTQEERKKILIHERNQLSKRMEAMSQALERLNHKIATYEAWSDKSIKK